MSSDYESSEELAKTDDQSNTESWRRAIVGSFIVHLVWIGVLVWYVKFPDSILCSKGEGGGFRFTSVCPEVRPFRDEIELLLGLLGPLVSMLTGMYVGRVGLILASIVYLAILLSIPAAMLWLLYLAVI